MITMKPIGTVRTTANRHAGEWGDVVSQIILDESLTDGLLGLADFSHIVVIYHLDQAAFDPKSELIGHPRGLKDLPRVGVFARRTPHRPNPIGITNVRLLEVKGNVLTVQGLDALDGSPVLDIKPYTRGYDAVEGARFAEWAERLGRG
ncbi:MAG: tRNA (N6-threonylcarbamoyladenosine(37)-N6)-methyltransferase TrmO [Firmicutes bacterium]|nr:tRNA (N6-threonylcarbamoyladenosine(37)-N6)-methyltransferase TrmO [Bacillota bacterium]